MRPILFDKNATEYTSNGLGRLDCTSCIVTEERNGMFELEAEVSEACVISGKMSIDMFIVAPPAPEKPFQPFRVYEIIKNIGGTFTVHAQHRSYQLSHIPAMPFSVPVSSSACAQALAALKANAAEACPFTFWTDVTTNASYHQDVPSSIRQRLGGVEGSILDRFGGEYEWDNLSVKLHRARGQQVPAVTLRYGKNITDLEQEESISNTVTGVCPFWKSSESGAVVTLPEKVVESPYADRYAYRRTVPVDLSQSFEVEPTVAELRAAATAEANKYDIGIPEVSIKVSFVDLADTEEYKAVAPLERVYLCDMVNVYFESLGISTTAKVVKCVYDVLLERYESVEIGTIKSSLASTIADTSGAIETASLKASFEVRTATSWLTSGDGFIVATKDQRTGQWKELLFMDTADVATAKKVLRVNENGIGFSSTGVNGPYTQAWTLDGRMVIGGTNVPSLTVYHANGSILFQIDNSGMEWNAKYSSMTKSGIFKASGASITGDLTVLNAAGAVIFQVNANGIYWNLPNSSMTTDGTLTAKNMTAIGGTFNDITVNSGTFGSVNANEVLVNNESLVSRMTYIYETLSNNIAAIAANASRIESGLSENMNAMEGRLTELINSVADDSEEGDDSINHRIAKKINKAIKEFKDNTCEKRYVHVADTQAHANRLSAGGIIDEVKDWADGKFKTK